MTTMMDVDYLVVGAGATGLAFVDTVVEHSGARVAVVDRRHGVGGHWLAAYPFVRLHQASSFYGVASQVLGGERVQDRGPEAGLFERADQPTICAYYSDQAARLVATGQVTFLLASDFVAPRAVVSRISGRRFEVAPRCRIVDARYLAPQIPAETAPRFVVGEGARVVSVNDLVHLAEVPSQFVVVGSGKTATDACIWLISHGVDPGAICWVRPREPWMLNRAVVQPDPAVIAAMAADVVVAAIGAVSLEEVFLRLEERGVMLRIDPSVMPTMAKAPTLGTWELELLRTVTHVVRGRHVSAVQPGQIHLADGPEGATGVVQVAPDAVIVNCAADGLRNRALRPIWSSDLITLQPVRAGFPCFGAALAGYVEATRVDDRVKNRLCPPSPLGNTMGDWARMQVIGARNARSFGSESDIAEWANRVALNPARVPPDYRDSARLALERDRYAAHVDEGLTSLEALAHASEDLGVRES